MHCVTFYIQYKSHFLVSVGISMKWICKLCLHESNDIICLKAWNQENKPFDKS